MMNANESTVKKVSPAQLKELAAKGPVLLIDVRTPAEHSAAHMAGSELHPLQELNPAAVAGRSSGATICLICRSGRRALEAAGKLSAAGCGSLMVLEGGLEAWEAAGLPVVKGRGAISLERQVRIAAGLLVALGTVLGAYVHPAWLVLPAFVGAGLAFAGITDSCGMAMLLARAPWNQRSRGARSCSIQAA